MGDLSGFKVAKTIKFKLDKNKSEDFMIEKSCSFFTIIFPN